MTRIKKSTIILMTTILIIFTGSSLVFAGAGGPGAPWYPDTITVGKTEYTGKLYITLLDTGKKFIPGGIGNQTTDPSYTEYVVEVYFILELVPKGPNAEPLYFSGIGKTCESDNPQDIGDYACEPETENYYDRFYLPGDYLIRIGAALHNFLDETVYPSLPECNTGPCFLEDAPIVDGEGNAEEVVESAVPPPVPWFWVQPLTIRAP